MKYKECSRFGYTVKNCKEKQGRQIWQVKKNGEGEKSGNMKINKTGGSGSMEYSEQNGDELSRNSITEAVSKDKEALEESET